LVRHDVLVNNAGNFYAGYFEADTGADRAVADDETSSGR
jgi:hypothetical protein